MLNKTLRAKAKKIKSAHKSRYFLPIILFVILSIFMLGVILSVASEERLKFGNKMLQIESVSTPAEQEKGLGERQSLNDNEGMLFIFDAPGLRCIWMKDMNFPIDILWLDENKKVIDIKEDIAPDTYPETFCSQGEAEYVLEVNAGLSNKAGVSIGAQL